MRLQGLAPKELQCKSPPHFAVPHPHYPGSAHRPGSAAGAALAHGRHLGTGPECGGREGPRLSASILLLGFPLARVSSFGEFSGAAVIYCFCSNDCSMSDYKCFLAGGPDSENSHDLLPKLMEPQTGLMSLFRHRPHLQGGGQAGGGSEPDTGLGVGLPGEESGGHKFH